jgi:hypothetical protein
MALKIPIIPGTTASARMDEAQKAFAAQPARTRSLNEMRKGGKVKKLVKRRKK